MKGINLSIEKDERVRYLRALERFSKSLINILKRDDYDEEKFKYRVAKNYEVLKKVQPVFLDQPYPKALSEFANLALKISDKEQLLKSANALEKLKNSKNYKKDKHKNSFKFQE